MPESYTNDIIYVYYVLYMSYIGEVKLINLSVTIHFVFLHHIFHTTSKITVKKRMKCHF